MSKDSNKEASYEGNLKLIKLKTEEFVIIQMETFMKEGLKW